MARTKPLSPAQERARQTFRAIRKMRDLTHEKVAERAGVARGFIESKSCGASAIDLKDIELLAPALGVAETVFLMEPEEAKLVVAQADVAAMQEQRAIGGGLTPYQGDRASIWYTNEPHRARGLLRAVS